jgi:hypothetical protein
MAARSAGAVRWLADRASAGHPGVWQRHRYSARSRAAFHARHAALRVCAPTHLVGIVALHAVRRIDGEPGPDHRRLPRMARRAHRLAREGFRRPVRACPDTHAVRIVDQRMDPAARTEERDDQPDCARLVRHRGTRARHLFVLGHGVGWNAAGAAACVPLALAGVSCNESRSRGSGAGGRRRIPDHAAPHNAAHPPADDRRRVDHLLHLLARRAFSAAADRASGEDIPLLDRDLPRLPPSAVGLEHRERVQPHVPARDRGQHLGVSPRPRAMLRDSSPSRGRRTVRA